MKFPDSDSADNLSMLELFRAEAESQAAVLTNGLLELERGTATDETFEALMRAAHSLKGAARIINLSLAVQVAHGLEDYFVTARQGQLRIGSEEVDALLRGVDFFSQLARNSRLDLAAWEAENRELINAFLVSLPALRHQRHGAGERGEKRSEPSLTTHAPADGLVVPVIPGSPTPVVDAPQEPVNALVIQKTDPAERVLRLGAGNLNRLLALAGEALVESRWLRSFADALQQLKRHQSRFGQQLESLRQNLPSEVITERAAEIFNETAFEIAQAQRYLGERVQELDVFDRRSAQLSQRLYLEVLRTRMRPFSEGVRRFPRMVRDLARSLGKEVNLEVLGESTQVDRDILERLETPLAHLLRNAVDHGCESPAQRRAGGKSAACAVLLEARHSAGVLLVTVSDDGAGVDLDRLRQRLIEKQLLGVAKARDLSETELLEYLFVPGFSLRENVTEISGRGVGLDVVQNMIKSVRGGIRIANQPGKGFRVQLQLPLTLSVLRGLLVEIGGEPYAFPLNQIARILKIPRATIGVLEGRHTFRLGDNPVSLLAAHQVLECGEARLPDEELPVVVLGERSNRYGLIVDRFIGERELVVQPLEPRLGKVQDISAAALMESGAPVLIVDVDELLRSIEQLTANGRLSSLQLPGVASGPKRRKRILVVDDSLTVRELERKLLLNQGYLVEVAVDGMEAWTALRSSDYDLVITDVDMPQLDGIGLTTLIKKDSLLKSVPVMIVSYKERAEDRMRGLEAGADYYLMKGSFQDENLMQAVLDLIGEPEE